jgi:hypothetical protein
MVRLTIPPSFSPSPGRTASALGLDGEATGVSTGYVSFLDLAGNNFTHARLYAESRSLSFNAYNSRVVSTSATGITEANVRFSLAGPQMFVVSDDLVGLGIATFDGDASSSHSSEGTSYGFYGVTGNNANFSGSEGRSNRSLRIGSIDAGIHSITLQTNVSANANATSIGGSASAEGNMSAFADVRLLPTGAVINPTRLEVLNRTVFINDGTVNVPAMFPGDSYRLFAYGGNLNFPANTSVRDYNLFGGTTQLGIPAGGQTRLSIGSSMSLQENARLSLGPNGRLISEDSSGILGKGGANILGYNSGNILAKGGGVPRPDVGSANQRGFDDTFFVDLGTNGSLIAETSRSTISVSTDGKLGGTFQAGDGTLNYRAEVQVAGTAAPGDQAFFSAPGQWNIRGSLTLASTATSVFDIEGLAAGTEFDFVQMHELGNQFGEANLAGDLVLSLPLGPRLIYANQALRILDAPGGIVGHFANAPSGTRLATREGNASFIVTYEPNGVWLSGYESILGGDFDLDGDFDCQDVDALVGDIAAGWNTPDFDLTGDGVVDGDDLSTWLVNAGSVNLASGHPYLPGDATLDGLVDGSDFGRWNSHKFTATAEWCGGDFNADGVVDGSDFGIWNSRKFTASDSSTTVVPEPCGLLFLGALLLISRGTWSSRRAN